MSEACFFYCIYRITSTYLGRRFTLIYAENHFLKLSNKCLTFNFWFSAKIKFYHHCILINLFQKTTL
jgi:hypothetical protein